MNELIITFGLDVHTIGTKLKFDETEGLVIVYKYNEVKHGKQLLIFESKVIITFGIELGLIKAKKSIFLPK